MIKGFAADMGDVGGSIFVLILSLIFLCLALYGIVRLAATTSLDHVRLRSSV